MNKFWFFDLENVGVTKFEQFSKKIKSGDTVYVVYSKACLEGAWECQRLMSLVSVETVLVESPKRGSNALDFVLAAEIARVSMVHTDVQYSIVSGDTGFDSVVEYLRTKGVAINRVEPPSSLTVTTDTLEPLTEIQRTVLYDYIMTGGECLPKNRQLTRLHDICLKYGKYPDIADEIYKSLKPCIKRATLLRVRRPELGFPA